MVSRFCILVFVFSSLTTNGQEQFNLNGAAEQLTDLCYRLIPDSTENIVGSILNDHSVSLDHSFDLEFVLQLGCQGASGEGLAFILQTSNTIAGGKCPGAGLGYGDKDCNGLPNSLAVEIDTKYSKGYSDISSDHLALIVNGDPKQPVFQPVRASNSSSSIKDCQDHSFRVSWRPYTQTFNVYFDGDLKISYQSELKTTVFDNNESIYYGFTTASGKNKTTTPLVCIRKLTLEVDEELARKEAFENGVSIFPNPVKEDLQIAFEFQQLQNISIQLYDSDGNIVYDIPEKELQEEEIGVYLPGLKSGVYFVRVSNGFEKVTKKVVHISNIRA